MPAFTDFRSAAAAVLDYLHRRIGFDLWMVTRTAGEEWIILQAEDHGYGIKEGSVLRWADSFCARMVEGEGPHIAPRCETVAAYEAAAINKQLNIGAYVGFPLEREDGTLFGTLCAIHPAPQPDQVVLEQPLLELLSRLLSTVLNAELRSVGRDRRRERDREQGAGFLDKDTGLFNRVGWEHLLDAEEERCKRFGEPAAVLRVSLEGPGGDESGAPYGGAGRGGGAEGGQATRHVARAHAALAAVTREADVLARLGPRDFAVLANGCDPVGGSALLVRLTEAFAQDDVAAAVAVAQRGPEGLRDAWEKAELTLADLKRKRAGQEERGDAAGGSGTKG